MFDIHCHLLPGIDDGATDIQQSLALARHAAADGITHVVVTPHIQPGVYDNNLNTISDAFEFFQTALLENRIALNAAMAAEVRLCPEILPMLEAGTLPLFVGENGQKTMLLELPHSHVPPGTEQMIRWLFRHDVGVLVAHPERNKELMRNFAKLESLVDLGCKMQVTAGSIAGRFGEPPRAVAEHILKQGWCDLLASDAHNLQHRPPQLSDGEIAAAAIIGREKARALVADVPRSIVGGMFA